MLRQWSATQWRTLQERSYKSADLILLSDEQCHLAGVVETIEILAVSDDIPVPSCRHKEQPIVSPLLDQERAAELATQHGELMLVIVDNKSPEGVMTAFTLLRVMAHEHHEDLNHFVGMTETRDATAALESSVLNWVAKRTPWLMVGLALSSVATAAMSHFESVLEAIVTLALFIPAVIYITDAVGTQSEAIAVRGLSLSRRPLGYILLSEKLTDALIGVLLGLAAFIVAVRCPPRDYTTGKKLSSSARSPVR